MPKPVRPPLVELWSARRDGSILRIAGEIDMANAAAVRDRVIAEIRAGVVHLDLSAVRFFGVAGMDTLLDGHAVLHSQGKTLRLTCPPVVVRMMHICGLTELEGLTVTIVTGPDPARRQGVAAQ